MSINPSPITPRQFARRLAIFLPVLGIILTYTYAYIFELPYPGFEIAVSQIAVIHAPNTDLQVGDYLTQVGNTSISDFKDDLNRSLFEGMQVGEVVPLEVKRGAVPVKVQWQFTGPTLLHVAFRLFAGHWWLAYIFLLGGGLALWRSTLETEQQKILAAFFFITAIIIITSSVAWWHVWGGAVLMRAAIWIAIPIYLHLHWIFPKPFAPIHPAIHYVGYAASVAAAFAELFRLLPVHWHEFGFVIAMLGSLLLHIIRFVREKDQRRDTFRLFAALIIPSVALGATGLASIFGYDLPLTLLTIGFYTQGVIPFAYISVANRRRRGYFETQFNEITTISLFIAIILLVTALATEILTSFLILSPFSGVSLLIALVSFIVGTIFGVYLYPRFKQIIEQGWLGVPVSPSRIIESYASSIIRLANVAELADLLRHTVVPSLVIHQSALILIEGQELKTLYAIGVTPDALPAYDEIADLLGRSRALNTQLSNRIGQKHPWIQVVLPIKNNDHLLGFWLLGHHGSTDSYDPSEINTLNALGHFTAIALGQIIQSKTLRA
ncbi:MAG: hypothetical protein HZC38_11990, partial [Chloroflexi bacterium]|nr:hypothetical protein [Chloroflexota bacterium]